jgi:hypothetical protein
LSGEKIDCSKQQQTSAESFQDFWASAQVIEYHTVDVYCDLGTETVRNIKRKNS